ncbi:fructose-bisphosphate aldolase [Patescibacteria group bacterium]|nr:fructose-bisphosphate aldolase [Patescibacteria group bacterium]MBU2259818.1 fructose-bisphosphate aldolase [Patescibacteria group bacterium]
MDKLSFQETVDAFTDPDRPPHILAMDQSPGTHRKHMDQFGIQVKDDADFEKKAAQIRTAICTTPELGRYFAGAIQNDTTYDLTGPDGRPLMDHLRENGVIPIGKKCGLDKITGLIPEEDLAELPGELKKLVALGIHIIKIRNTVAAVVQEENSEEVAKQLIRSHEMCAQNGEIMPVLEPEFDIKNPGTLQDNEALMTAVLGQMCDGIRRGKYANHPYMVKTSFPTPGKDCETESIDPERSADSFVRILEAADVPPEILFRFLSGGHSPETSRILLQEMATRENLKNRVGTSFSRAILESTYQEAFKGGRFDARRARNEILRQGKLNFMAQKDFYTIDLEGKSFRELAELVSDL